MSAKNIYIILFILFGSAGKAVSQDINFSQFYELPMLRNPALAGLFAGDYAVNAAYRNQWQSVTTPYRTIALGAEYKKSVKQNSNDFFTLGLQATNDIAGDSRLRRTQLFPVLNFHKSLNSERDTYLSAAIMGGPVMQRFDPSQLTFDDQFVNGSYSSTNPTRQVFTNTGFTYWDLTAGLTFSSVAGADTRFYLGGAMFHITKPKVAYQQQYDIVLNPKYVVNAGLSSPLNSLTKIILYADYFMQGGARQVQGGLMLRRDLSENDQAADMALAGGLFYRSNDAFIPIIKLEYEKIGLGFTYDINTSKLRAASQMRGGFEATLSYKGFTRGENSSLNKVRCPSF